MSEFYGIFAPSGELEAVETTEGLAQLSALNMGKGIGPRTVRPVSIHTKPTITTDDAWSVACRLRKEWEKSVAERNAMITSGERLPDNYWQDERRARQKYLTAFALYDVLTDHA